jgi:hypothetical protein
MLPIDSTSTTTEASGTALAGCLSPEPSFELSRELSREPGLRGWSAGGKQIVGSTPCLHARRSMMNGDGSFDPEAGS